MEQLPPATPAALRQLLQRCLTKNPKNRLQSIGDARILHPGADRKAGAGGTLSRCGRPRGGVSALEDECCRGRAAPVALGGWLRAAAGGGAAADRPLLQFEYPLPAGHVLATRQPARARGVTRWTTRGVYGAARSGRPPRIFVRSLECGNRDADCRELKVREPVLFARREWLAFQQGQQIKKVALAGGAPAVVVENWSRRRVRAFGPAGNHLGPERDDRLPQQPGRRAEHGPRYRRQAGRVHDARSGRPRSVASSAALSAGRQRCCSPCSVLGCRAGLVACAGLGEIVEER